MSGGVSAKLGEIMRANDRSYNLVGK